MVMALKNKSKQKPQGCEEWEVNDGTVKWDFVKIYSSKDLTVVNDISFWISRINER